MLVNRVRSEGHRGSRAAREHVRICDKLDHIGRMTAACAFDMIDMNAAPFEDCCCVFKETCFIEAVGVDMALDVLFFADTIDAKSALPRDMALVGDNLLQTVVDC
jgi:hypothetical protein